MHKKTFIKVVAIVVCCGILSLAAPTVTAVEKKAPKTDSKFLKDSLGLLTSMFPILNPIFNHDGKLIPKLKKNSGKGVKSGGTLSSIIVSDGD